MSFGFSPTDIVKLLEISTRVYIAFKDANENSEAQVESLVREFQTFTQCLLYLDELMKEFGKPLPFPVEEFKKTLSKCEASLKPYKENLVDKRMSLPKIVWTIKYIGKEKEIDNLRKQIAGHCQALNIHISSLHLRLQFESSKRAQRLLIEPHHRTMSLGGQWHTTGTLGGSLPSSPLALPAPDYTHPLYNDWEIWNSRLKTEDAMIIEENRAKRVAAERRSHLAPSDAMKQKVREMPPAPRRTYTIDTEASSSFNPFESHNNMGDSTATLRPGPSTPSPKTTPQGSPQIEEEFFSSPDWTQSSADMLASHNLARSSVSTTRSSISVSPEGRFSPISGLGISTAGTSPEDCLSHPIRNVLSSKSLATIALGDAALQWTSLCRKVQVERKSSERINGKEKTIFESQECDIHWRYREDGGISLRSSYRSKRDGKARSWILQDFPSLWPSIPLTTTIDGDVSVDFPRGSFGKLDKQWTDIKYTFTNSESSAVFQTLLYTNNGKDPAELLFDRPVRTVSSDKNRPECRSRNLRLWRRTEMNLEDEGPVSSDVLVLLFYTSFLGDKGHWVEEPHYAFEWLSDSVYNKSGDKCDKLTLVFSKDPAKWTPDKLFQRRKSSQSSTNTQVPTGSIAPRRSDSIEIPGITRSGTGGSTTAMAGSMNSTPSLFGRSNGSRIGKMNSFGYAKLDIEFQQSKDRRAFLNVWKKYVKPLGTLG